MNIFESITEYAKREYTNFDMSNQWIGSVKDFGALTCIYGKSVIASDTWKSTHSILCKLPPLTAPAFTRIKGIVNTFYTSYASVWKHWNSFISNKPSDQYLTRQQFKDFNGKYVEPCVGGHYIQMICKLAYSFGAYVPGSLSVASGPLNTTVEFKLRFSTNKYNAARLVYSYNSDGYRVVSSARSAAHLTTYEDVDFDFVIPNACGVSDVTSLNVFCYRKGFANFESLLLYCCDCCCRNLQNHGFPTKMIAECTSLYAYDDVYFNLLPFIAESSVWQNFYRDQQNQSPEFCYADVNGAAFSSDSLLQMPSGWLIRALDTPANVKPKYNSFIEINTAERLFSLLTGFLIEGLVPESFYDSAVSSFSSSYILPNYYNGLLMLKYRNFDKDYFTSASVDPLLGGMSIATPNTIDALRTASKLEEFLERSASARDFFNFMKYNFGTNPESTRYSKPLLLGTEVINIQVGEQLQTSQTTQGDDGSPLGTRGGVAEGFGSAGTADHYFNEHGWLCSFLSFVVDSQYLQGIDVSDYFHHNQLDYPFPDFANLGAEPILQSEIYFSTEQGVNISNRDVNVLNSKTPTVLHEQTVPAQSQFPIDLNDFGSSQIKIDDASVNTTIVVNSNKYINTAGVGDFNHSVFGYTPRFARWKHARDVFAGEMVDSLEFWHTARHFDSIPTIGSLFVSYRDAGWLSNLDRIFADTSNSDKFILYIRNNCSVRRCLPLVPNTQLN